MISHRKRDARRRLPKMTKNLERMYKEGKCRDCTVMVTRMDFAKILGKFTKVKIQFESSSTPKTKKSEVLSPNSNARLKHNENGMVLIRRNAYNQHPAKDPISTSPKKSKLESGVQPASNVLKENNRLKKTVLKDKNSNISNYEESGIKRTARFKQYNIIFLTPSQNNNNNATSKTTLQDILPEINKSALPSEDWCIEYLPKKEERTDDKVYDRIAAELEDLMYEQKPVQKSELKTETTKSKVDEFPSIMDILNDNSNESNNKSIDQDNSVEFKTNLESSDVEAMLLGKPNKQNAQEAQPTPMEVDGADMNKLIQDVAHFDAIHQSVGNPEVPKAPEIDIDEIENPHSPSILDEALQKGIEEHLPLPNNHTDTSQSESQTVKADIKNDTNSETTKPTEVNESNTTEENLKKPIPLADVTHVVFKKNNSGSCEKLVICPKNLNYSIELEGKHVELIGAPKYISSLEDLQVLLEIVNDTELQSLYISM